MNLSSPGITYLLLIIPALFAMVVTGQGISKTASGQSDGPTILIFGLIFFGLIGAAYFFFIR